MSDKKIILKATKTAPEFITQGNHEAHNEKGYFTTENRAFADSMIANGHGVEVAKKETAPAAKAKAAKPKQKNPAAKPPAKIDETGSTPAAPPIEPEKNTEGETK